MNRHNILLVDDSPNILRALKRIFRHSTDYNLFTAESATEALSVLDNNAIDLLITDECMPQISGTELLKTVRELYPHLIRFMLTGQTDIEVAKNAINQGQISRFFTKPCDDFELMIAVRYALQQKELEKENTKLKSIVKSHEKLLKKLEAEHPGITERKLSKDGSFIID
jgi:DNA-binding NtrC family response regulator